MFSCTSDNTTTSANHVGCLCHGPQIRSLTRRIDADLSRRGFATGLAASIASLGLPKLASAQSSRAPGGSAGPILFTRFRLFDGTSSTLRDGLSLLVEGNRITALATGNPAAPDGAHVIDCGGRTVMPGLIDAHWHSIIAALPLAALMSADVGYIYLAASAEAERTLMHGFTTVRDLGGPSFALKQAIDDGLVPGPRIYPSGAMITATGGHGDLRPLSDVPSVTGTLSRVQQSGGSIIADGPDAVRLRVREQLMQAASQDQACRKWRHFDTAQPTGRSRVHRARIARGGRSSRRLGHLRHGTRLYTRDDPAGDRCWGQVRRTRASYGRSDGQADVREGHMVEDSAIRRG